MNEPRQFQFYQIGMYGCQLLSMIHIAEGETGTYIDAYQTYLALIRKNLLRTDCYLLDHDPVLNSLTWGKKWVSSLEAPDYVLQSGEHEVQHWIWQESLSTLHEHYICPDYDPYGASLTVKNGHMQGKRVYRRVV